MKLSSSTKVFELIEKYPFLLEFLAVYNPKFSLLKNSAMRATMGRLATLSMVSQMGDVPLDDIIKDIAAEIKKQAGEEADTSISPQVDIDPVKVKELKDIILALHDGAEFSEVKKRFDSVIKDVSPSEIAAMEEELISEGMPAMEIQRLCDLHVSVLQHALEKEKPVEAPEGHPVHTFMQENVRFGELVDKLNLLTGELLKDLSNGTFSRIRSELESVIKDIKRIELHYLRKENQLFPFLEKHNITGPSKVMWGFHDEARDLLKKLQSAVDNLDYSSIVETGPKVSRIITEMIYKENTILFPLAMNTLTDEEWIEISLGEDEVGYSFSKPTGSWAESSARKKEIISGMPTYEGIELNTGKLTAEQIDLILKHLPVDLSFVDENDEVRYYSDKKDRFFPRSPGVIGRKVQNCHPPGSVHIVTRIVDAFRNGLKDHADFWIEMNGRLLYIVYYAVRDEEGSYKGTIEVTQDLTDIKKIEGEKRLLDWEG